MSLPQTMLLCLWISTLAAAAQNIDSTHKTDSVPAVSPAPTNQPYNFQTTERVRTNCIQNRRIICGRIVKVLPEGLVVDSGYTSLRRHALERSWLIPATVEAEREPNLVEKNEPDCPCVGLVFLTDMPELRRARPKVLDFVVLEAFPAGEFTYTSVGSIQHTVRHYSASLPVAVRLNLAADQK